MTSELSGYQKELLAHIEFIGRFYGVVSRADLVKRFDISEASATRTFQLYNSIAPDLTIDNLEFIYAVILEEENLEQLREKNFTAICSTGNADLLKRVESDFDQYLHNVLLKLENNSKEDESAVISIVNHSALDIDGIRKFLERQTIQLPNLDGIPERLHAIVLKLNLVKPTWENCLVFINSEIFEADTLVEYLEQDNVRESLLSNRISGEPNFLKLRQFLLNSKTLSDETYREYLHALPKQFTSFPEQLEPSKLLMLIEEDKIVFNEKTLEELNGEIKLQLEFVVANVEAYLEDPEPFELSEEFLEDMLRTGVSNHTKIAIIKLMDLGQITNSPEGASLIGPVLNAADTENLNIDASDAQSIIIHSRPIKTQISLFNKYNALMTDNEVHYILDSLPKPFCEIKTGYNTPRLKNTSENQELANWLDSRNIISSKRDARFPTDDIKINLYRR